MTLRPLILALAAALLSAPAAAAFPERLVTLVVPFAPGGPTDALARHLANALKDRLHQSVIVENKAGAGGNIGAEAVARAPADGYTLLFGTSGPLAINVSLYKKLGYDPLKSFDPVIMIGHLPNVLTVHPAVPANSVRELVAYAKANPKTLSFASSGNGASSHLAGEIFNRMAGTEILHVPYRGTGPALNDLVAGQVSMSFTDVLTALPLVQAGKLRALGTTTAERSAALPDLPTLAEQGLAGFDVSVFFGIAAARGTPPETLAILNRAFAGSLADPRIREVLASQGIVPAPSTEPAFLAAFMEREVPKWREVVAQSGAQLD